MPMKKNLGVPMLSERYYNFTNNLYSVLGNQMILSEKCIEGLALAFDISY